MLISDWSSDVCSSDLVDRMDLDARAFAAEADDAVAGNGVAAVGEGERDARGEALDRDRLALRRRLDAGLTCGARHQRLHHRDVVDPLQRDRLHKRVVVMQVEALQRLRHRLPTQWRRQPLDDLIEYFFAECDRFFTFLRFDEATDLGARLAGRSEEHTSELQSLMRISYAVFCLKKKTK